MSLETRAVARLTDVVGVAGTRGRTVGSWLDIARSVGVRSLRRRPFDFAPGVRDAVYAAIWREAADRAGATVEDSVLICAHFYAQT